MYFVPGLKWHLYSYPDLLEILPQLQIFHNGSSLREPAITRIRSFQQCNKSLEAMNWPMIAVTISKLGGREINLSSFNW